MRSIVLSLSAVILVNWLFSRCANPSTINGGPQDTIPPVLLETIPPNGQLNFSGETIQLLFSEDINTDKLKQELIITPFFENEFKFIAKKRSLTLEFENRFPDSTTFILNFADGVGDLNENNPVVNLKYAFSTGQFIDSLTLKGYVYDLLSNEPAEKYLISMYDQDTSSVFEHKPTYFAYADEEGLFTIENIKSGRYHIYAIDDKNKNLLLEPLEEKHGLLTDTLSLDSTVVSIEIPVLLQDASELSLVRTRSQANRFDIRYSKHIYDYSLLPLDTNTILHDRSYVDDQSTIRFYPKTIEESDSTGYIITVYDSLGTSVTDTTYVLFQGTSGRIDPFEVSLKGSHSETLDSINFHATVSKPIKIIDPVQFQLLVDTLVLPIDLDSTINFTTNSITSEVRFALPSYYDYVNTYLDSTSKILNADTLKLAEDSIYADTVKYFDSIKRDRYTISFKRGWLYSIEKDTAVATSLNLTKPVVGDVGLVRGNIYTTHKSYFVELITDKRNVVKTLNTPGETYEIPDIPPGSYSIRVRIDTNEDGIYSYGNIRRHLAPEPIFFMEESFEVRANWELEGIDLSF